MYDTFFSNNAKKKPQNDEAKRGYIKSSNFTLNQAFRNKKDEFYTMYEDVEKEMNCHKEQFFGKTVLCNCDDPFESAFFRFFVINFAKYGIKSLITTCYSNSSAGKEYTMEGVAGAYKSIVREVPDISLVRLDDSLDLKALFAMQKNSLEFLAGDGDFRSPECEAILNEADIVVTNPPFSLLREYMSMLVKYNKQFIILGNMNAITCKELFPLVQEKLIWYGDSIKSGDRKFYVPDDYLLNASGCGVDANGRRFIRVKGVRWFTNMDTPTRHRPLDLHQKFRPELYPKYENYDAIEVGKTKNIPFDYDGVMGVPITFLDKYCPEQFDILMLANGNAKTNVSKEVLDKLRYKPHPNDRGGVGIINGQKTYARIMIQKVKK